MAKSIKVIIKDNDRKSVFHMGWDLLQLFFKYKSLRALNFYGNNMMYKKNAGKIFDYLTAEQVKNIHKNYYRKDGEDPILQNKIVFNEFLRKHHIPTTDAIGKIEKGCFYRVSSEEPITIQSKEHLLILLERLLEGVDSFFVKQIDSQGGADVFKLTKNSLYDNSSRIDIGKDYIIERTLVQHKDISAINPKCINTLRVITIRKGDNIEIASAFLRMGIGDAKTDNASSGGIFVGYDLESNKLDDVAYRKVKYGGESFFSHPNTNFTFKGGKLVFHKETKDILIRAALLFDRQLIGWDIAYTPEGPIIIEGNDNPGLDSLQISAKGALSIPIYKEIFKGF